MNKLHLLFLTLCFLVFFGCTTGKPSISANPKIDQHGLVEVNDGPFDEVFVKQDLDLKSYKTAGQSRY